MKIVFRQKTGWFVALFVMLVACVLSCEKERAETADALLSVSVAEVFLSLPDTTVALVEGYFTQDERQKLLDDFTAQKMMLDGQTSIDYVDDMFLSVGVSNGFGQWNLDCIPLKDELLGIVIADINATDATQAVEFYTYKNGKAKKTENFGYKTVEKKLSEVVSLVNAGQYDRASLRFNANAGILELETGIGTREGEQVWYDYFAFDLNLKQFVELVDYPQARSSGAKIEELYDGFVKALNDENYILALQYVSRQAYYEHTINCHDELCWLEDFLFSVMLSGNILFGDGVFDELTDISDIERFTVSKDGRGNPFLEGFIGDSSFGVALRMTDEPIALRGDSALFFAE